MHHSQRPCNISLQGGERKSVLIVYKSYKIIGARGVRKPMTHMSFDNAFSGAGAAIWLYMIIRPNKF